MAPAPSFIPRVLGFPTSFFHTSHLTGRTKTEVTMSNLLALPLHLAVPPLIRHETYRFGEAHHTSRSNPIQTSLLHIGHPFSGQQMTSPNRIPTLNPGAGAVSPRTLPVIPSRITTRTCNRTLRSRHPLGAGRQSMLPLPSATPPTHVSLSLLGLFFLVWTATPTLPWPIGTLSTMSVRSTNSFPPAEDLRNITKRA